MAVAKKSAKRATDANEVDAYLRKLDSPLDAELQALRAIILGADPVIREGIKWNSPSFRVNEWFATANIRKRVVMVILHLGAKVRDDSSAGLGIKDPSGLLNWLAKDRASVEFADMKAIKASRKAFADIVRQWIAHVP